jgi:hypothetical protein
LSPTVSSRLFESPEHPLPRDRQGGLRTARLVRQRTPSKQALEAPWIDAGTVPQVLRAAHLRTNSESARDLNGCSRTSRNAAHYRLDRRFGSTVKKDRAAHPGDSLTGSSEVRSRRSTRPACENGPQQDLSAFGQFPLPACSLESTECNATMSHKHLGSCHKSG